jgi:hypothetical protein
MYPGGVENQLRHAMDAAIPTDHDARNWVLKAGRSADVPELQGEAWAKSWDSAELLQLAGRTQAQRQDWIYQRMQVFLHDDVANRMARVNQAAAQSADVDLQLQGQVAQAFPGDVVAFNFEVLARAQSSFTGKVRYVPLTDIDVETSRALIEVTTQRSASGKVAQLQVLQGAVANPRGKPVLHFMPNADAGAIHALTAAGSCGVLRTIVDLQAAIRALP